jgi:hypothetical protein
LIQQDNWYLIVPNIFYQSEMRSIIENKLVNHKPVFITNDNIINKKFLSAKWHTVDVSQAIRALEENIWYNEENSLFEYDPSPNKIKRLILNYSNKRATILREGQYFLIKDGNSS